MVKNFTIYGERCSGTNCLETLFTGSSYYEKNYNKCFDIPVTWDFGWKHFFGHDTDKIKKEGDNTLFIGIVRNPYDWLMSLHEILHHVPLENHEINNFLLNEWYSLNLEKESKNFGKEYEEDKNWKTKKRYKNIFELRKNKMEYLYNEMPQIAKNYMLLKYEDLHKHQNQIISYISDHFGLKVVNKNVIRFKKNKSRKIEREIKKIIDKNINWKIESKMGYFIKKEL